MPRSLRFALLLTAALGLRVFLLDQKNVWLDEVASWDLATHDLEYLIATAAADVHPPLYYLLLKGWIAWAGESAAGLRGLSVAAGVAGVGFLFAIARRLLPLAVAVAATIWVVVSPHAVFFAQEARMYAPAAAAVLGFCLAYRAWVDSRFASRLALIGYVAGVTCALYLHYFTAFAVAAVWMHTLLLPAFPWRRWLAAHAVVVTLYLPWAGTAAAQLAEGQPWRAPVGLASLPVHAWNLFRGLAAGDHGRGLPAVVLGGTMALGLAVAVVQLWFARRARHVDERHAFLVILASLPVVAAVAALPLTGELFLHRYLAYSQPLVVLAVASMLGRAGLPARTAAVALSVVAVVSLLPLGDYYRAGSKDSDVRPIIRHLEERTDQESSIDAPVLVAPGYMAMVLRYAGGGDVAFRRIDTATDLEVALAATAPGPDSPAYLVVDYRWPGADRLRWDPRLEAMPLSETADRRIVLYRIRRAALVADNPARPRQGPR